MAAAAVVAALVVVAAAALVVVVASSTRHRLIPKHSPEGLDWPPRVNLANMHALELQRASRRAAASCSWIYPLQFIATLLGAAAPDALSRLGCSCALLEREHCSEMVQRRGCLRGTRQAVAFPETPLGKRLPTGGRRVRRAARGTASTCSKRAGAGRKGCCMRQDGSGSAAFDSAASPCDRGWRRGLGRAGGDTRWQHMMETHDGDTRWLCRALGVSAHSERGGDGV